MGSTIESLAAGLVLLLVVGQEVSPQVAVREEKPGTALEPPVPDAWLARVSRSIQRGEYHFSSIERDAWSAPNRAHGLRSRVGRAGLDVFSRETGASGAGAGWKLSLATTRFGRAGDAWPLECSAVTVEGERAELEHGWLVEWFENSERGIEQGWTIERRPAGVDALEIGILVRGDLTLRLDQGGRSGVFVDGRGEARVAYRGLLATDATGRELEARLEPGPEGVVIRIDDARAVYPVTVDPLLTSPAWTAESNQAGADFGVSVATAGDVNGDGYSDVIVGARGFSNGEAGEGRAYVYHGSSSGLAASAAWTAESNQTDARFGQSVSTAGDVNGDGYSDVIVGAWFYNNGESNEGRAYVYHGSSDGLAAEPAWTSESDQVDGLFGISVSTAGDVNGDGYSDVIVGARGYDNGESNEGRAYVYHGSSGGLAAGPAWTGESEQADASFGNSVSTAGDVNGDGFSDVIVGAWLYDNGQTNEGRAYVYHGSSSGLAASPAWTAETDQTAATFGRSVSTAGDVNGDGYSDVIVGAELHDNGELDEGRAHVYHGSSSGLATSPAWTVESNQLSAFLGNSAGTAGDVNGDGFSDVLVGAPNFNNGHSDEGRAYVYHGSSSGLAASPAWTAESNQTDAHFGESVSMAGDVNGDGYSDVIVGANLYNNIQIDEGRAYVYHGSVAGLAAGAGWTTESNQAGAAFNSVSTAGDVNGDGYSDVIVGVYLYDNGETDEGRAFLYHGSSSGLATSPAWTAESNQAGALFGNAVRTAGDVNGDGYSDVIVGAYSYDNGETDEGRAYVYHGSPSGLAASPAWTVESNQAGALLGTAATGAGDVNGDGYGDVIVGAYLFDNGESDEGRVYVYHGSAAGLAASPAWTAESNQTSANLGNSAWEAGDVNGDGYSDVIVAAWLYDNGQTDEGRAYVYHGSSGGLAASPAWTAESDQAGALLALVATAGDVNGDGYSDVILGAFWYDNGETDEGRAYVYHGSSVGLAASPAWTAESNQAFSNFGHAAQTAGDVNGDGYSDVILGALFFDNGELDEGRAYVYHGSASGLAASPAWTAESNQTSALLGHSAGTAGDVNGDGYSDVIVGSPNYDNGQTDEGGAFVYHGNGGDGGLVRVLQQRNRNDTRPISVLGRTGESGLFHVRAEFPKNLVRFAWASPAAPEAWLEWEVKPLGVAFDGSRIERGPAQSLAPAGGTLAFDEPVVLGTPTSDPVVTGPLTTLGHARLTRARTFHWRARVATNNPLFPHTAWFGVPGNNVTEAKLRKPAVGVE